jgi:hypothetical protein
MFKVHTRMIVAASALALAAIAAVSAYAVTGGSSSTPPSLKWNVATDAGARVVPSDAMKAFATQEGVLPDSLRQAVEASSGLQLVIGSDAEGRACTAEGGTTVSNFSCVSDWSDKFAMLVYSTDGGSKPFIADHASVVGLARPDVARVVVTTAGGSEMELPINAARGFSYDATTKLALPDRITAYDKSGDVVGTEDVE